jgi:hypothetical protein
MTLPNADLFADAADADVVAREVTFRKPTSIKFRKPFQTDQAAPPEPPPQPQGSGTPQVQRNLMHWPRGRLRGRTRRQRELAARTAGPRLADCPVRPAVMPAATSPSRAGMQADGVLGGGGGGSGLPGLGAVVTDDALVLAMLVRPWPDETPLAQLTRIRHPSHR